MLDRATLAIRGRLQRRAAACIAALAIIIVAVIGNGQPAHAVIPDGVTEGAYIDINSTASTNATISYSTFIASLRIAASTRSSDGGLQTQNSGGDNTYYEARFRLDGDNSPRLTLIIRARDLYVVAFRTRDHTYSLTGENYQGFQNSLGFGANYNALAQAAGRQLGGISISHAAIVNAVFQLSNVTLGNYRDSNRRQTIAQALQLLIQMTSESARFNGIETYFRRALTNGTTTERLSSYDQSLERNWGTLSNFFYQLNHNSGTATVPNINGTVFTNQGQVRRTVFVLLGKTAGYLPKNNRHDEL